VVAGGYFTPGRKAGRAGRIFGKRLHRRNAEHNRKWALAAISEPLRMLEKKVGIQAGFVTRWLGATGGPIFRKVFSAEVVASVRAW
jgi:hypothetical protein